MADTKRVAVVGGGIIGLTAALRLARAGHGVTIFDAAGLASGASRAANGALTPHSDHNASEIVTRLAEIGTELYPDYLNLLASLSGVSVDLGPFGVLEVFMGDEAPSKLAQFEGMSSIGYAVRMLDQVEARRLEPMLSPSIEGAIWYTSEAWIDTQMLMEASISAIHALGVSVRCHCRVTAVFPTNAGARVVHESGDEVFDMAVVTTGGWACDIGDLPTLPVLRIRGEIIESRPRLTLASRCLYRGDSFITPRADGRLLLGTSYVLQEENMDENRETVSIGGAARELNGALAILPDLAEAQILRVWKGWRPTLTDDLPLIELYEGSILIALGFSGLGVTLAPAVATVLANAVEAGMIDDSLRALSLSRFSR